MSAWQPDSVTCPGSSLEESYSYITPVPESIRADAGVECVLGVDEAGRGPVLGPMVYGVAYCSVEYAKEDIARHGFMDSKVLDHDTRVHLLQRMSDSEHILSKEVGWTVRVMSARDIGAGMLRPTTPYNLNAQAHDTTIQLIRDVYAQGVNIRKILVDTVGIAETYQHKLQRLFPMAEVTVSKKADSLYPIVSVASICAKVTRDKALDMAATHYAASIPILSMDSGEVEGRSPERKRTRNASTLEDTDSDASEQLQCVKRRESPAPATASWGSGYPSDERTKNWLLADVDPIFGWHGPVRYSWSTVKDILESTGRSAAARKGAVKVTWYEDEEQEDGQQTLLNFNSSQDRKEGFTVQNWFGKSVGLEGFK